MAPIVLLLTFSALEISRANMIRNTANNAAYEGARALVVPGAQASSGSTAASGLMQAIGVSNSTVTVTPSTITNNTPSVTVSVAVPLGTNGWFPAILFSGKTYTGSCTLNRELESVR